MKLLTPVIKTISGFQPKKFLLAKPALQRGLGKAQNMLTPIHKPVAGRIETHRHMVCFQWF